MQNHTLTTLASSLIPDTATTAAILTAVMAAIYLTIPLYYSRKARKDAARLQAKHDTAALAAAAGNGSFPQWTPPSPGDMYDEHRPVTWTGLLAMTYFIALTVGGLLPGLDSVKAFLATFVLLMATLGLFVKGLVAEHNRTTLDERQQIDSAQQKELDWKVYLKVGPIMFALLLIAAAISAFVVN